MELVGREGETREVRALLRTQRVVTLWGPGGIGKTSLARAVAGASASELPPVFVALAAARNARDLHAVVAGALDLGSAAARTEDEDVARLGRALAARGRVLVVLDNVEQIVAEAAHAVAEWSALAPEARFVVTSRTLLGISNEAAYELLPLRLEAGSGASDAVRLLELRARAVRPSFEADAATLAGIAARVEGIPLAIELAAARLAIMSASQLLERLGDRLGVLGREHGGAEQRQRTMRSTIEWSWGLLSDDERRALAELSVTRGFDLGAALAIVSGAALGLVGALRTQSLLATVAGEPPRFYLLDTIREFATQALPDVARAAGERHAAFYGGRAAEWVTRLSVDSDEAALEALGVESENLVAVVERFCAAPRQSMAAHALHAIVGLEIVLLARGAPLALVDLARKAMAASEPFEVDADDRARGWETLGTALLATGELAESRAAFERAHALATPGAPLARARERLASVLWAEGRGEEALARATEALDLAQGHPALCGQCSSTRGVILHTRDRFAEARECYERALEQAIARADRRGEIRVRSRLGFLLHDLGDPDAALEQYAAARDLGRRHGIRDDGSLDGYVGNARRATGDIEGAVAEYDSAIEQLRRAGSRMLEATFTMDRGIAWTIAARHADAVRDLELALALSYDVGSGRLSVLTLGYLVVCHASEGRVALAREVLARARAIAGPTAPEREILDLHEGHALPLAEARERVRRHPPPVLGQHRRLAVDLLQRAIDRAEPPAGSLRLRDGALYLASGGVVRLGAAKLGVVRLLVARRVAAPGSVVATSELIAAGWPDERIAPRAATNRLRVLISNLRSDGVRAIESADNGYRIAPDVTVLSD